MTLDSNGDPRNDLKNARVITHDGEPAVELPNGQILQLRMHVTVDDDEKEWGRTISTETEVDADDFAWWIVYPAEDGEDLPEISIEPELIEDGDGDG